MASNWNEYTYEKKFEGNMRGSSGPVPMRVNTNLRMMSEEMVRELQKLDHRSSGAPQYIFMRRDGLPLHPSSAGHRPSLLRMVICSLTAADRRANRAS